VQQRAAIDMDPLKKQPIDATRSLQPSTAYRATAAMWPVSKPFKPGPNSVQAPGPDTGVTVRLDRVRNGPPFLLLEPTSPL